VRIIEGQKYLTTGDLGAYVNRSPATIVKWCKYSDRLSDSGKERLIPKPLVVNGQRLFTTEQALAVKEFSESKKYGKMAEFNRKSLGKRGADIEKRMKAREKEQEKMQEEKKEKELEVTLSKVNRRAVDYTKRFQHIKKNL
jgi:DNA-binding transcriptional MerR regulator